MISRRGLLTGLTSLLAAPAIVRVSSLMPVKVMPGPEVLELHERFADLLQYRQEFIAMFENRLYFSNGSKFYFSDRNAFEDVS